jgi:hypothetical protein
VAQFNAAMGRLQLEIAYSEDDHCITWNCLVHREDQLLGSLGGTTLVAGRQDIQEAVEDAVGIAIRSKYPLG